MKKKYVYLNFLSVFFNQVAFGWTLLGNRGWNHASLTLHANATQCGITSAQLNNLISQAIQAWNGVTTSRLEWTFQQADSTTTVGQFLSGTATDTPYIGCDSSFQSDTQQDPNSVPAVTLNTGTDPIEYAGIVLNAEPSTFANIATIYAINPTVVALIIGHELGHVVGLGHTSDPSALMYYSVSNKSQLTLTLDDQEGVSYLYPRAELWGGPMGCAAAPLSWDLARHPPHYAPFEIIWWILPLLGLALPRRKRRGSSRKMRT